MKSQSIACFTKALLALAGMSVCSVALGQEVTETHTYKTGESIKLEVSFSGPGASEIRAVGMQLIIQSPHLADQEGFLDQVIGGNPKRSSPTSFTLSLPVPTNAATGDYQLVIDANPEAGGVIAYKTPSDFQLPIRIENDVHIKKPKITVKALKP